MLQTQLATANNEVTMLRALMGSMQQSVLSAAAAPAAKITPAAAAAQCSVRPSTPQTHSATPSRVPSPATAAPCDPTMPPAANEAVQLGPLLTGSQQNPADVRGDGADRPGSSGSGSLRGGLLGGVVPHLQELAEATARALTAEHRLHLMEQDYAAAKVRGGLAG